MQRFEQEIQNARDAVEMKEYHRSLLEKLKGLYIRKGYVPPLRSVYESLEVVRVNRSRGIRALCKDMERQIARLEAMPDASRYTWCRTRCEPAVPTSLKWLIGVVIAAFIIAICFALFLTPPTP